jgi:phospholipid/cholesterol/gamma-HCH transport system ATP-binding protein
MIAIHNLTVAFDGRNVLDRIALRVPSGHAMAVLGKNGSGKSVLLKVVCGLIGSYGGSVEINGIDIREFFRSRESGGGGGPGVFTVAYVFQKGGLFDSMNIYDNVAFGLRRRGIAEERVDDAVTKSIARVGLSGNESKLPSELSGGMQKRVGLARAICMRPDILLYDDPTAGLDPVLSDSIADLMLEIRNDLHATSIVVTQDLGVARKVADSVALLYGGSLVYQGSRGDFFAGSDPYAKQFIEGDVEGPIDIF